MLTFHIECSLFPRVQETS